jgi:hypothetical protein
MYSFIFLFVLYVSLTTQLSGFKKMPTRNRRRNSQHCGSKKTATTTRNRRRNSQHCGGSKKTATATTTTHNQPTAKQPKPKPKPKPKKKSFLRQVGEVVGVVGVVAGAAAVARACTTNQGQVKQEDAGELHTHTTNSYDDILSRIDKMCNTCKSSNTIQHSNIQDYIVTCGTSPVTYFFLNNDRKDYTTYCDYLNRLKNVFTNGYTKAATINESDISIVKYLETIKMSD